jgi:hypothetical protein
MTAFDEPVPAPTEEELKALLDWAVVDHGGNAMQRAAAHRNVMRWASAYGAKMVARMKLEGLLRMGQSPLDALDEMLGGND